MSAAADMALRSASTQNTWNDRGWKHSLTMVFFPTVTGNRLEIRESFLLVQP